MKVKTIVKIVLVVFGCLYVQFSWAQSCNCKYTVGLNETNVDGKALGIKPGDVVCIQAGNRSTIRFANFQGTAAQPIIIKNCGGLVNVANSDKGYALWFSNSRYFRITGTGDAGYTYGIRAKAAKSGSNSFVVTDLSSDVEIDHVEIPGSGFAGIMVKTDPRCDLTANRGHFTMYNVSVHDNYVHDVSGEGMYIGNSFYNGWTGNSSCSGTTLYPHDIIGCKVFNNKIKNSGAEAIQVGCATSGCEIYGNNVELFGQDPFANYQNNGIQIGLGTGGLMYDNVIKNGPGNGIIVLGKGDNKIYNNVVINAGANGIYCDDATTSGTLGPGFTFINNTVINPGDNGLKIAAERVSMNHFINNIIVHPGSGKYVNKVTPTVKMEELNNYYETTIANAKFANATAFDYHLLSTSPALNKGTSVSTYGVTKDYDGKARPAGGAYDIGAFEFQGTSTNAVPTVNAGADKTVILPTTSVSLTGTASDSDGSIASYSWTKVSGPTATLGSITTATLNVTALLQGTYTFRLTVKDNAGASAYDDVVVTVNTTASKPPATTSTVIYRVNTGGSAISASPLDWVSDTQAGKSKYLDAASANYTSGGSNWSGTNSTGAPNNLFGPNRYSPNYGGTAMQWNFPVQSGTYQVNLYFAESPYAGGVKQAGARVFHVNAENNRMLSNLDIYAAAGMNALKKTFQVSVTDGTLDLDFVRSVGNPQVNGIEIISLTAQTTAREGADETITAQSEFTTDTTATASIDENAIHVSPNPFTDKLNLNLDATSHNVSVVLQDMSGYNVLEEMQQNVSFVTLDFSMRRIPAGVYIITVNADGKISKQRLIKK
ncbi:MAG TPA: malectin domain-containing carbohydrate-binding protein [Ohtaekwangia sp.]|uniref:PKD domain-containing protein n=1 Tax=Ohtaekwangia sp. TaxID=2066019 RepID=UPI002F92522B